MHRLLAILMIFISFVHLSSAAFAATFNFDSDGRLSSVEGLLLPGFSSVDTSVLPGLVTVADSYWDVRFEKGSCRDAFGICNEGYASRLGLEVDQAGLTRGSGQGNSRPAMLPEELMRLLSEVVLIDRAEGNFRLEPETIAGCNGPGFCQVISFPELFQDASLRLRTRFSTLLNGVPSSPFGSETLDDGSSLDIEIGLFEPQVYAVFSLGTAPSTLPDPAPAPVPLPASVLMLAGSLAAFAAVRRARS